MHNPLVTRQGPINAPFLGLLKHKNNRLFTRVRLRGSGIECEWPITPTPPCLECLLWCLQAVGWQQ
jgi:hypothetical protein